MWIQTGITHYILGITLILTLVAANPYRPPTCSSKLLLNTQWPDSTGIYKYWLAAVRSLIKLQVLVGSLVKLTPEENWYDMEETVAQQMARLQLEVQYL